MQLGLGLAEASARVSTHAADYLGLADRGRLAPGAWADAVVLDRDLKLQDVYVEGARLSSRMLIEAREAPTAVARQLAHDIKVFFMAS